MTQIEAARKNIITRQMTEVAEDEGLSPEEIRALVATGEVVIPHNIHHDFRAIGIGKGLRTKVNANIGASNFHQLVRPTEEYGLHGRIGFQPARLTGYGERWEGDDCVLWAEGTVRQGAVYGESMELHRRIEARLGESRFTIRDEVTNVGFDPTSHMYLYHVNVGWPVVDVGSEYLIPAADGVPVAEYPTRDYRTITAPGRGFPEECYEHDTIPEPDGRVPVAVVNRAAGLGAYQLYRKEQLPFHTMWRMLGEGTYGVAMEPTTNRDAGRFDAKERGELMFMQPGETRSYELEVGALDGGPAIDAFAARVEKLKSVAHA